MKNLRKPALAFLLSCFISIAPLYSQNIHVTGEITDNETWSADTVFVDGDVTVNQDFTLTVDPGTYVEFQGYYTLIVYGKLLARGTETNTITFTVPDTIGFYDKTLLEGAWHGIRFDGTYETDTSVLEYCVIEYATAVYGEYYDKSGGGIRAFDNANLVISNCIIRNNYGQNDGGGIYLYESYARISHNTIYNNHANNRGGGLIVRNHEAVITENLICDNYGKYGGGGITIYDCDLVLTNNIVCNNEVRDDGGGVEIYYSELISVNNTICFNIASRGGGIYISDQTRPVFYNDIVWGNEAIESGNQVYMLAFNPEINFNNCNIQDNTDSLGMVPGSVYFGEFLNNIDTLPGFVSPSGSAGMDHEGHLADWSLLAGSPCINKGTVAIPGIQLPATDVASNRRISHGGIDMGAYEFYLPSMEVCGEIDTNTTWTADTVFVNCDINILDTYTLTINPGTMVLFQGPYQIEVHGTLLALGTESDSIIFTVSDTTGFSDISVDTGGWKGIEFHSFATNDSSKLLYSRLEYGKRLSGPEASDRYGGAIYASYCYRLLISNSTITNNIAMSGGGISCFYSPISIRNSTISHNRSTEYDGGGLAFGRSDVTITGCYITNNNSKGGGGGISLGFCEPIIENCIISYNKSESLGGGGIYSSSISRPIITGNTISFNEGRFGGGLYLMSAAILKKNLISNNQASYTGGGINAYTDDGVILADNIICNNSANTGGGIGINAGISKIINNTIVNNHGGGGGGVCCFTPGVIIENSILWGNTSGNYNQFHAYEEDAFPDILYSNIQGGLASVGYGSPAEYPGRYENNIDSVPGFINPTDSSGMDYNGLTADWSLPATSASVNGGDPMTDDPDVLPSDFYGNPRINMSVIDMGAIENQSTIPVISEQPLNYTKCVGDSVEFSISVSGDVFYQWQMNESNIPGATLSSYRIDSIVSGHDGNYQCVIRNAYGTFKSNPAFLQVKSPPEFLSQPEETWVEENERADLPVFANGTDPNYQWRKDGTDLMGEITDVFTIHETSYDDVGSYDCIVYNSCGADTTEPANIYLAPQICMVTVSTTTGHNLVVWEKKSAAPILAYNIYRESVAAGIYDRLATLPYDDLSVFVDTTADPTVQAYLYKITAVLDTALNETDIDLCSPHKTVHLIVSTNPELNTTQLQWDRYYGFDYQTYTIYRSNTGVNFDPVHSLSASSNSWTDPDPSDGDLFYRIAVEKPMPCEPDGSGKKAGTGPYRHSLSNMDNNKLKAGELPPDTITLSNYSIEEEKLPATVIGKLITADEDSIDVHTYQFVPGEGDNDNLSFTLLGDLLLASETFDYETKNQYSVRIRSTDLAGNYCEVPFIIMIIDIDETTGLPVLNAGKVKAFPNPFSQSTTITFPNPSGDSHRMVLMDVSGKFVRIQENITTEEFILKRNELGKGLYILELKGEKTYRGKLVIE